ncbi:MAG: 30S ribosomal protein S9 [Planctomycetaceae bacterium]|jgi:small subunit ribosomal protein S9
MADPLNIDPTLLNPVDKDAVEHEEAPAAPVETTETAEGATLGLEIGSVAEEPKVRLPAMLRGKVQKDGSSLGTGRRKTAVARVRVRKGAGKITVNGREFEDFFPVERNRLQIEAVLKATGMLGAVDIDALASGGGVNGQAGAIVLGLARAIQALQPELHGALSDGGYLTRDDRMVERKKYGHKKARRSFQFSKR